MSPSVALRLATVRASIAKAATEAGRDVADITLVGVSKRHPAARVVEAVGAGLTHVGESFAQETRDKWPEIRRELDALGRPLPRLHFVGRLQRNKVRLLIETVDCFESVDRLSLAREISRRAEGAGRSVDVLLQVNVSDEEQKGGVAPDALPELHEQVAVLPGLRVAGLMTIGRAGASEAVTRGGFARLRELRDLLPDTGTGRPYELSMGMSADFLLAIAEGATLVRVGTGIFGPREDQDT